MSVVTESSKVQGKTPLMRQYYAVKERHPGTILLFRMGDFYETFEEDAEKVHSVLGITLTKRSSGAASKVSLAGFPYHALDTYLPKLVKAGFRVAICEQLEEPIKGKKIVDRDVVEIVTPGVSIRTQLLDPKQATYLVSVHLKEVGRGKQKRLIYPPASSHLQRHCQQILRPFCAGSALLKFFVRDPSGTPSKGLALAMS